MSVRVLVVLVIKFIIIGYTSGAEEVNVLRAFGSLERSSRFGAGYIVNIKAIIAQDGRFLYNYDTHQNYSGAEVAYSFDGESYYYLIDDGPESSESLASITSSDFPYPGVQDEIRDTLWLVLSAASQYDAQKDEQEFVY